MHTFKKIEKYIVNLPILLPSFIKVIIIPSISRKLRSELYLVKEMFVFAFSRFWHLVFPSFFFVLSLFRLLTRSVYVAPCRVVDRERGKRSCTTED